MGERRTAEQRYRKLGDGSVWPTPGDVPDDDESCSLEWRLRYAQDSITSSDKFVLASIVAAYRALLTCPSRRRNEVIRMMRPQL
jgi:hypothetical protein